MKAANPTAFVTDALFDGQSMQSARALLVEEDRVAGIVPRAEVPRDYTLRDLGPGLLAPGFVDLQVNGGGGVMFNDAPTVATLGRIAGAHAGLGTTGLLPTLITDTPDRTRAAIDAAIQAISDGVPGIAGLHLEGPHLSVLRKGAHDPALIRAMQPDDLAMLIDAATRLPSLMVTVAPEVVAPEQIAAMASAGIIVSLGHSDADYATCARAAAAGARCVTHLFNTMTQLGSREPGLVGAALTLGGLHAGLIADGIHVHPATIAAALRAKAAPGAVFLVTDAMATAGSAIDGFRLNGRAITRRHGRLTLRDGTLAGADLDMARALRVLVCDVGIPVHEALAMATSIPARVLGRQAQLGHISEGARADFIHLDPALELRGVWRGGECAGPG